MAASNSQTKWAQAIRSSKELDRNLFKKKVKMLALEYPTEKEIRNISKLVRK